MRTCFRRSELDPRGPRRSLNDGPPKLRRGAFCVTVRADSACADESSNRGCPKPRKPSNR
eukprot:5410381-Alexandrium_andersonii.AAC.1